MKKIISLIVCILLLTACGGNSFETIDSNRAMEIIKSDAIVLDVRGADEYNTGHIEGSMNVPVTNIAAVNYPKEANIIVYCATGVRSAQAAKELVNAGYTNVYNLDGRLINWGVELVK